MSKKIFNKEASKVNWYKEVDDAINYPGDTDIIIGCLQRIAESNETIAGEIKRIRSINFEGMNLLKECAGRSYMPMRIRKKIDDYIKRHK